MDNLYFYHFIKTIDNKISIAEFLNKKENEKFIIIDFDYQYIRDDLESQNKFFLNERLSISNNKFRNILKNLKEKINSNSFKNENKIKAYYYTILKNYLIEDSKSRQEIEFLDIDGENTFEIEESFSQNEKDDVTPENVNNIEEDFIKENSFENYNQNKYKDTDTDTDTEYSINNIESECYNIENDLMYKSAYKYMFNELGISQLSNRFILKTTYNI